MRIGLPLAVPLAAALALGPTATPLAADGVLDPTFGNGGRVITSFGRFSQDEASAAVVLPDGRVSAAGQTAPSLARTDFGLARYLLSGALDPSFDVDGLVSVVFDPVESYASARSVLLQPDGKLVAVGGVVLAGSSHFALARLDGAGALDPSFGSGGKVTTFPGQAASALSAALQPDGRIVVAGVTGGSASVVARYLSNGTLDASFGAAGLVTLSLAQRFRAQRVALQADGRILVAGTSGPLQGDLDFALVRLLDTGALDPSFGSGGVAVTDFLGVESVGGVALLGDGRIVLGGSRSAAGNTDVALVRYEAGGALDTTFGAGGLATGDAGANEVAADLLLQPDGKLLLAGWSEQAGARDFLLSRFSANGALDASFGTAGFVRTDFEGGLDEAYAVAIASPGRVLAAGRAVASGGMHFGLARYTATTPVELQSFSVE